MRQHAPALTRVGWLLHLARALGEMHREGRVHGRVEPEAVRLDGAGRVSLMAPDRLSPRSSPGPFTAPEAHDAGPRHPRVDVYGWGAVAYELLEGHSPQTEESSPHFARGRVDSPDDAPVAQQVGGDDLALLILECLLWEPDDRPLDMAEVEERLVEVLQDLRRRRRDHAQVRAGDPMRVWRVLSALVFPPLVFLGYQGLTATTPPPAMAVDSDFGEVIVQAGPEAAPPGARFRLKKGGRTVGILPAPAPGTRFTFPVEGTGSYRVELVDGETLLAAEDVPPVPEPPTLRLRADRERLQLELAEALARKVEVRLRSAAEPERQIPLLEGQRRLSIAWRGEPGAYEVQLADPQTGKVLRTERGVLQE